MSTIVKRITRTEPAIIDALGVIGTATVHEAQGRRGLLGAEMRPIYRPIAACGSAVTCEVAPGDNLTIHIAIEYCQPGDILVVAPSSPCSDGYFGDLLAESLNSRGVRALIIDAGVRDVATITEMKFPVWSKAIFAQGTVKATIGNVNMPLLCAGALVHPGDVIVADDDGIVVVGVDDAAHVLAAAQRRVADEAHTRQRLAAGELSIDVLSLRNKLSGKEVRWIE